jgi:hypothetical protein
MYQGAAHYQLRVPISPGSVAHQARNASKIRAGGETITKRDHALVALGPTPSLR